MLKRLHIILNPAAGQEEPILTYINRTFLKTNIDWDISITKKKDDAKNFAKEALGKNVDAVVVYGGDGTVMEVAQALYKQDMPLAILPGGTANVMAKELGIPTTTLPALEFLKNQTFKIKTIDMATCNNVPMLIRLNIGITANIVKHTKRKQKDQFGRLAYGITAVKELMAVKNAQFTLTLDGKKVRASGAAMIIANSGNVGIQGLSLVSKIAVTDGLLDVLLIKTADLRSILTMATNTLLQKAPPPALKHWQAKKISVQVAPVQNLILDDASIAPTNTIEIEVVPKALNVLVPA